MATSYSKIYLDKIKRGGVQQNVIDCTYYFYICTYSEDIASVATPEMEAVA